MSPSRRTICSTWPFVDGVRHAGSMKEIARITDGSAATYRCLISINARTIYVVVWAALVYRSKHVYGDAGGITCLAPKVWTIFIQ